MLLYIQLQLFFMIIVDSVLYTQFNIYTYF